MCMSDFAAIKQNHSKLMRSTMQFCLWFVIKPVKKLSLPWAQAFSCLLQTIVYCVVCDDGTR